VGVIKKNSMTLNLHRLKELNKWIEKRIINAGVRRDKKAYDKWVRYHRELNKQIDRIVFTELKKVY
jgi:hypothetical protein